MSQSNFVQPLLNSPMDPFAQQAMEEERRYKEAQQQMLREQRREDFQVEQGMRGEAAQERLAMELEARRKAAKKDLKMRRGFQVEDDETKRGYIETDLANQRIYNLEQSNLMAGELPELREKIRAKGMQLSDLQNNILVDTLSPNSSQEALETTQRINEDFLASLLAQGVIAKPPLPGQRGSIISSTSTFLNWLKGRANGQMPLENVEASITAYRQHVGQAKQNALQDPRMANQILSINGTLRQLQGREATILAKVQGGGIDYSSYSGVTQQPRPQMYAPTPATPGQQKEALDAAMGIPASLGGLEDVDNDASLAELARYESGVEDTQVGADAFSGIEDMHSAYGFGNPFEPDEGLGSNEFQMALDQTDKISDDGQAVRFLLEMRQRLNESQSGAMSGLVDRMEDAQGEGMYDNFVQFLAPSDDGTARDIRNFLDASTVDDVDSMEASTKGAYASLNGYIENRLAERDPDGTLRPQVQTILDREAVEAAQQASQQTP